MGNYQKKKKAAKVHNSILEFANNLLYIGQCECGGELLMYMKSNEENIYKIYCNKCDKKFDFREIENYDKNFQLFFLPSQILNTLKTNYGEDIIERTYNLQ
jgi:hypothetical protein